MIAASFNDVSDADKERFFLAAEAGDMTKVRETLAAHPEAVYWQRPVPEGHSPFEKSVTALTVATIKNNVDVMRLLLENHADVNAQGSRGLTALHQAAWCGHLEAADVLLRFGAKTNIKNNADYSPYGYATMRGNTAVATLILNAFRTHGMKFISGDLPLDVSAPEKATWKKRAPSKP